MKKGTKLIHVLIRLAPNNLHGRNLSGNVHESCTSFIITYGIISTLHKDSQDNGEEGN